MVSHMQKSTRAVSLQLALGAAVAVVLMLASTASAISFPLAANTERCFTEEVPSGTSFKVTYAADLGYGHRFTTTIVDAAATVLFDGQSASQGTFTHHSQQGGDYKLCFSTATAWGARAAADVVTKVSFTFKTGTEGIDYTSLATKEKLRPMEVQLRVMEDTVRAIHNEYIYYKEKEAEMRSTNEHMTAKVVWMAIVVIAIFIAFSYLQLRHLKSYFRKKRMID